MAGQSIFINYRREDTADVAGRVYDVLSRRFGKQKLFKDVDSIDPGVDFGDYIKGILPRCRVALTLIGPNWLSITSTNDRRRLDDEHDWVRIEIETALAISDLLVVPVLVNGAQMPRSEEVPASLKPLLRRNAAVIRRDPDFHGDVARLAKAVRKSLSTGILDLRKIGGGREAAPARVRQTNTGRFVVVGGALVAVGALAIVGSRYLPASLITKTEESPNTIQPAPTETTRVDTPPTSSTQNSSDSEINSVSGTTWRGRACWESRTHECYSVVWAFHGDGNFVATNAHDPSDVGGGTWKQDGQRLQLTYDNDTVYVGNVEGSVFTGTMQMSSALRGSFQMTLQPSL